MYFNEAFDINCKLTVIPMSGYNRSMDFSDTLLPFVLPSPNIPTIEAVYAYMDDCI